MFETEFDFLGRFKKKELDLEGSEIPLKSLLMELHWRSKPIGKVGGN